MLSRAGRRKRIRVGVVEQLRVGGFRGRVFIGRQVDQRQNVDEYVEVYLARGTAEANGNLIQEDNDTLTLAIKKTGQPTDDDLDSLGDAAEEALLADCSLGGIVAGIVPFEFEYPDDSDRNYDTLLLSYTISSNAPIDRITEI